jgi:hypothetical protein
VALSRIGSLGVVELADEIPDYELIGDELLDESDMEAYRAAMTR